MNSECIINFDKSTIFHGKLVISSPQESFAFYIQLTTEMFEAILHALT